MSNQKLNRDLIAELKKLAWSMSRVDQSMSYQQWLNHLSEGYGEYSYQSLLGQVKRVEIEMQVARLAAAEEQWIARFAESKVWGAIPHPDEQTIPLPIEYDDNYVPWPHGFAGSHIFYPTADEPHKLISGPVFSIDQDVIEFHGEQLWHGVDQFVLMALICISRTVPTGAVLDFAWSDLEKGGEHSTFAIATIVDQGSFQRALWRLAHGVLVFDRFGFHGPILKFVDVSKAPDRYRVAFNPDFGKFYYPARKNVDRIEISTGEGNHLPWSEKLATYLTSRPRRWIPFRLGEWLETLPDNEFTELGKCLADCDEEKSSDTQALDMMNLVFLATAIETRQSSVTGTNEFLGELLNTLRMVIELEKLERLGLIELTDPLGIASLENISLRLTAAGMELAQSHEDSTLPNSRRQK